jgi:hypothetical protein
MEFLQEFDVLTDAVWDAEETLLKAYLSHELYSIKLQATNSIRERPVGCS